MSFDRIPSPILLGLILFFAQVAAKSQSLAPEQRTNGSSTLKAIQSIHHQTIHSQAVLEGNKTSLQALILTEDGYLLTQASEANALRPWKIRLSDQSLHEAREVRRNPITNLLLLHIPKKNLQPVEWTTPKPLLRGQWLWSFTHKNSQIRLGAISAQSRQIPNSGVVLGVRFAPHTVKDFGLLVEEVAQQGPAFIAGLQCDDVIMSIDSHKVKQPGEVKSIIENKSAGEEVKIHFLRQGKSMECSLRLASKDQVMYNWAGEDFGNHGTSLRTDNFPWIIQHHIPLQPQDMGGAVFDLEGKAVGINISRVDRVTNYAIPVEIFEKQVLFWIEKDRAQQQSSKAAGS